jgi:hypothetical protein
MRPCLSAPHPWAAMFRFMSEPHVQQKRTVITARPWLSLGHRLRCIAEISLGSTWIESGPSRAKTRSLLQDREG